ncbi:hypothetical protein E2562_030547 [Oryza meyeriana var. granulata]|uniref:Uncharacterized protein n=1 Tax=Oryza meyeriana var. granulata TaxID=110450 RepID=A0A6G1D9A7_9ORYZ|nr:hypothetical protein E2562_030547 [Oryza meyeriana var. granulata]
MADGGRAGKPRHQHGGRRARAAQARQDLNACEAAVAIWWQRSSGGHGAGGRDGGRRYESERLG